MKLRLKYSDTSGFKQGIEGYILFPNIRKHRAKCGGSYLKHQIHGGRDQKDYGLRPARPRS
jgi:hypothetical protein